MTITAINEPDMSKGWVFAFRRAWENPAFLNLRDASIWQYIFQNAVWEPDGRIVPFAGRKIPLKRGQFITSIRYLADQFCCSEKVIRRVLQGIEEGGLATLERAHRGTILSICKYNVYQPLAGAEGTPAKVVGAHRGHTEGTNTKEGNKYTTTYIDETRSVGGAGGTVASDPPPPPEPDEHGQGDIDKLARWAEATGYDRREVAQLHAAPIESAPPDLGLPDLGGNVVSIGTGKKPRDAPGTRWPVGQRVPDDWIAEGRAIRRDAGLPEINMHLVADMFADHWASAPRSKGVKSDWRATWRNWVRRQDQFGGRNHGQRNSAERNGYSRSGEGSSEEINLRGILRGVPGLGLGSG